MKRVVLTGYRGTGKTAIGTLLAQKLGVPFVDTDALIEKQVGRPVTEIFLKDGEDAFRALERSVIATLPQENAVIGTGGGSVNDPENMERLRKGSVCVLLKSDYATIERRLSRAPRPPLTDLPLREEIRRMIERRRRQYAASADFCVNTSTTTPDQAADRILFLLKNGSTAAPEREAASRWFLVGKVPNAERGTIENLLAGPARDPLTRILGIAGWPAAHSRSPHLFNRLFARYGLNYHYTWFEDSSIETIMRVARDIDAKGLSVTIPFKQDVIVHLDRIDRAAEQIGAVNTVVFSCGIARGFNTDWIGIEKPLAAYKGKRAVLLGAGGVAAAAAYALTDLKMEVTILNRTYEKAVQLAERFGCNAKPWDAFGTIEPDLVVNATPLGMQPDLTSPLRADQLKKEMTVFDLVYTPPLTPLLREARKAGCTTIPGTEVFIYQAKDQFRLFFGIDVPDTTIREILA
jgi:Shikimate 5-dehydrogenase